MRDERKTKAQLVAELEGLRRGVVVEQALDRVRVRSLGMQTTEDLPSVSAALFLELLGLEFRSINSVIGVIDDERDMATQWTVLPDFLPGDVDQFSGAPVYEGGIRVALEQFDLSKVRATHPFFEERIRACGGNCQSAHYSKLWTKAEIVTVGERFVDLGLWTPEQSKGAVAAWPEETVSLSLVQHRHGYLFLYLLAPLTESEIEEVKRFAEVFAFAYGRFLELKQKEDQNRALEAANALAEEELQTARQMQMGLMPSEPPTIEGLQIAARCVPATQVGGDFFQYFHRGRKLLVTTADVTGHGMAAAIPVVLFDGILDSQIELADRPEDLFNRLNDRLVTRLPGRRHVCFSMAEIDIETKATRFTNAGCPYPYHYIASSGEITELQLDAYPLGVRPGAVYTAIETQLYPGDRLVFCCDGIMEAQNADGGMFGFDETAETIRRSCLEGLSADGLLERLFGTVKTFSGNCEQEDDQTIVVVSVED